MCGRFAIISSPEAIRRLFGYSDTPNFPPRYNVAPTQPIPTVMQIEATRRFRLMRWGLIPAWAKDPAKVVVVHIHQGQDQTEARDEEHQADDANGQEREHRHRQVPSSTEVGDEDRFVDEEVHGH